MKVDEKLVCKGRGSKVRVYGEKEGGVRGNEGKGVG